MTLYRNTQTKIELQYLIFSQANDPTYNLTQAAARLYRNMQNKHQFSGLGEGL